MIRLLLLILTFAAPVVMAGENGAVDAAGHLGRTALGLLLVLGLVFALAWAARRSGLAGLSTRGNDGPIRLLAQRSLGARERLVLVEVDGRKMLLGVVPGRISRLDEAGIDKPFSEHLSEARGEQ
ncbi:flagellar biosynthetic protein FliO [Wenzhouxiangella sp. AB-CW3]|uniref:flagellar biosynthetic protein FliO n=1 Tax=Wenzhouxiangella sp. AB-CW3 TaxID=2771012 RepID=UPI00168B8F76|nr:flagellar biosynthetic protein FliO [Wenzhouxiangella sp. AB-CW3]QOC21195.1 flagellar biosynthetic protein FliO [Wenzhouxiangella sp. AB-CW3]